MIGQYFTPLPLARLVYRLATARPGQRVMDPAAGDGAFLRAAPIGCRLFACELDKRFHAPLRKLLPHGRFIPGDALIELRPFHGTFDLVIGNPPYSAQRHLERRPEMLQQFDLGAGRRSQCVEILFLELFWRLAKPGGHVAIILPDGPLANAPFAYVRRWLLERARIETIVSLPRGTFLRTTAKTNILIARKLLPQSLPCQKPTRLLVGVQASACLLSAVILTPDADWRPETFTSTSLKTSRSTVRLGNLFDLRTGFARYGRQREIFDLPGPGRILLIRAKNFRPHGGLRLDANCAYISRIGPMFSEKAFVQPGEILFVRVGAGCYGRAAVVPPGLAAQADDWIHILTPKATVNALAIADWLNGAEGRAVVQKLAKGVGTLSISKSSLRELHIPKRSVAGTGTC